MSATHLSSATPAPGPTAGPVVLRGPAGSTLLVEPGHTTPLVEFILATRSGSGSDPRGQDGRAYLAAEIARRGAAGRSRSEIDAAIDALGASLNVLADADSVQLFGRVLFENLDPFLALIADIVLRPDFLPAETERTRREALAALDELRNDDRALCSRFFERQLFGTHGYGRATRGTVVSLGRLDPQALRKHFRAQFSGQNLVFALGGAITPEEAQTLLARHFAHLPRGRRQTPPKGQPKAPSGLRIQIVDKPDRQQVQIMLGHLGPPIGHPDADALLVGLTAFGGSAMSATLMQELRVKRGLTYGAYFGPVARIGAGAIRGSLSTGEENLATALHLVLQLYGAFAEQGLDAERSAFFRRFLAGSQAALLDDPQARLSARVNAILAGQPATYPDTFADRIRAVTDADIARATKQHLDPKNLVITLVASAGTVRAALIASGIPATSISVVPYDSY